MLLVVLHSVKFTVGTIKKWFADLKGRGIEHKPEIVSCSVPTAVLVLKTYSGRVIVGY